jgi:hydroxyacylglutathione hydrolase
MHIEQLYTGCLAEAAYYIESDGEAAIIDPLRETAPYLAKAEKRGAKIKYIFETHFHADFVSGHIDLAEKTGAPIIFGPMAQTGFKSISAEDGQEFSLGKVKLKVLHTPGHTMESSCFLLLDEKGLPHSIYSGDTLFIGDVGRPDLAIKSDLTVEDLAAHLYDSLHSKVMTLPDEVIVYPAHGAGSACGKNLSKDTFDTLGNQKKTNYALKATSKEEFIKLVTEGLATPPQYFPMNARVNKEGYESLEVVMNRGLQFLSPQEFEDVANATRALILDTRDSEAFSKAFIPNSINIGIDGPFAPWVGALITDSKQAMLLVTEAGQEEDTVTRLARVGYDNAIGVLKGGIDAWVMAGKETDRVQRIDPAQYKSFRAQHPEVKVLDVRREGEFSVGKVSDSQSLPLDFLNLRMDELDRKQPYLIHCAGGYRSMIAASILKSRGFENIQDITGGYNALKSALPEGAPNWFQKLKTLFQS